MKDGLDWSAMPKTFRDAIEVARALSVKYIWIDSLCIIQDDAADWEVESSRMQDVYANAYLTIGVAVAASDKEGFLGPRTSCPTPLDFHFPGSQLQTQVAKLEVRQAIKHNRGHPLYHRGWVLQERLLSKRIVFFEREELVWDCRNRRTCECLGLDNYENESWGTERPISLAYRYSQRSHADLYGWWKYYVLEEYAKLALTFSKDRLPALSGLASKVARQTGDTYLAGLWQQDLLLGLLWSSQAPLNSPSPRAISPWEVDYSKPSLASLIYRAPTWSWASIDGRISHSVRPDPGEEPLLLKHMNVLDVRCITSGRDPTGAVADGHLKISCPVIKARININNRPYRDKEAVYRLSFSCDRVRLRSDQYETPHCFTLDVPLVAIEHTNDSGLIEKTVWRSNPSQEVKDLVDNVIVRIAFITTHLIPTDNRYNRYSLVLGPSRRVPGAYERVGFWGYYNEMDARDYLESAVVEELTIV